MSNFFTKKVSLTFCLGLLNLFLFSGLASAQTGPGGVERTDGTSHLRLWLKGEGMAGTPDLQCPNPWADASGYGRNFTNPTPGDFASVPIRSDGGFGDFPALRFRGILPTLKPNNFMSNPDLGLDLNNSAWTIYVVIRGEKTAPAPHGDVPILSWGSFLTADTRERTLSYETTTGIGRFYTRSQGDVSDVPVFMTSNTRTAMENLGSKRVLAIHRNGANNQITFRINGTSENSEVLPYTGYSDGNFVLGAKLDFSSALMDGHDLAEVLAFDKNMDEVHKIILDNYLARKYNIALDAYDFSNGNSAYCHNPIGIGRIGDVSQTSATFTTAVGGMISLEEYNNTLGNGDFVMASHNLETGKTGDDLPIAPVAIGFDRWKRVFYIEKKGNLDVKLSFDPSNETALLADSYILLYRSGATGDFGKINITPCIVDGKVVFIIPDIELQNGYYTLGNEASVLQKKQIYSLNGGGDWQNPATWTFTPDGVTANNPCAATPDITYEVFISAGHTVNITNNFQSAAKVTVNGRLELSYSAGHEFTEIAGSGLIRLTTAGATVAFPTHTSIADFQSAGSVEYYGFDPYNFSVAGAFLTVSGSGIKTLTSAVSLEGSLAVSSGATLNTNQNIGLKKEWINNGTVNISGGTVTFSNTTTKQTITGATNFNNLTVSKASARNLEINASIGVAGTLSLNAGNIILGSHNLSANMITASGGFSNTNMIVQNGGNSAGISRLYVSATGANINQTYPVGTGTTYTPIKFAGLTGVSFLTISSFPYTSTAPSVVKRKWYVNTNATGDPIIDVIFDPIEKTGTPNALSNLANGYSQLATLGTNTAITNAAIPNASLNGEWTIGVTLQTLYAVANGDWNVASTWATGSCLGVGGAGVPDENTVAVICPNKTVTLNANEMKAAVINFQGTAGNIGTLKFQTTAFHQFGEIKGVYGNIEFQSAGFFTCSSIADFSNSTTNTVSYETSAAYGDFQMGLLPFPSLYPNLVIKGGGNRRITLPNDFINVKGDLTIEPFTILNDNDKNIKLSGNWVNNAGVTGFESFTTAVPSGVVVFENEIVPQSITGQTNFNRLEVKKADLVDVTLNAPIRVQSTVTLSTGSIILNNNQMTMGANGYFAHAFGGNFNTAGMVVLNTSNLVPNDELSTKYLIVEGTEASRYNNFTFPIGVGAGANRKYTPLEITRFDGTFAGTGTIQVRTLYAALGDGHINRRWQLQTTNISSVANARLRIHYTDEVGGLNPPQWVYFHTATPPPTAFQTVNPSNGFIDDGVKVFGVSLTGNNFMTGYWYLGPKQTFPKTYYSAMPDGVKQNYGDWQAWTTNASGNPNGGPTGGSEGQDDRPPLGGPTSADQIVILPGDVIKFTNADGTPRSNIFISAVELRSGGELDLGTTTGHKLGIIKAEVTGKAGLIKTALVLPDPLTTDYTQFTTVGSGTILFYNAASFHLPRTNLAGTNIFNNLFISIGGASGCFTTVFTTINVQVNGFLSVTNGGFRVGNDAAGVSQPRYEVSVLEDVYVGANACIGVGRAVTHSEGFTNAGPSGNTLPYGNYYQMYHDFYMWGNFVNYGNVRFTNQTNPMYNRNCIVGGMNLIMKGAQGDNVSMDLYNTTDLLNFIIDKGNNRFTTVTLTSHNTAANFRLFGRCSHGAYTLLNNDTRYPALRRSLMLMNGTLHLKGYTRIPVLTEPDPGSCDGSPTSGGVSNTDYFVGGSGALWLDDPNVFVKNTADSQAETNVGGIVGLKYSGAAPSTATNVWAPPNACTSFSMYGLLRVNAGRFESGRSGGFIFWATADGEIEINGGEVYGTQLRTADNAIGRCTFTMTGGLLELEPNDHDWTAKNRGIFSISRADNIFNMSGGTIRLKGRIGAGGGSSASCFEVQSVQGNYNVTGGTVEIIVKNTRRQTEFLCNNENDFTKCNDGNNMPGNLEIGSRAPVYNLIIKKETETVPGTKDVRVRYYPLVVLNDLTIDSRTSNSTTVPATLNANVAGSQFDVTVGGNMTLWGGRYFPATDKKTIFNGATQTFQTVTNIAFTTAAGTFSTVTHFENLEVNNGGAGGGLFMTVSGGTPAIPFVLNDNLRLIAGNFSDGGNIVEVQKGAFNNTQHLSVASGKLLFTNIGSNTSHFIGGSGSGIFGNVELSESTSNLRTVKFLADQIITGNLHLSGTYSIFDIDRYNLRLTETATVTSTGFGVDRYIRTRGKQSDGGLTKVFTGLGSFTYPVGSYYTEGSTNNRYMPYALTINAATTFGEITVSPNNKMHPLATSSYALDYYWHLEQSGFTGQDLTHLFSFDNAIARTVTGAYTVEDHYVPAFIDFTNISAWQTVNDAVQFNDAARTINFATVSWTKGDFTAGMDLQTTVASANRPFRPYETYYSMTSGAWNNTTTVWSKTSHTGPVFAGFPAGGDAVFITSGHTITVDANARTSGAILIRNGATLDLQQYTFGTTGATVAFGEGKLPAGKVKIKNNGTGFNFPSGDWRYMQSDDGGTFEYYATDNSATIPSGGTIDATYRNLILTPSTGRTITTPTVDLRIYENLSINGASATGQVFLPTSATGNLVIDGGLFVTSGTLQYRGGGTTARTVEVVGDIKIASGATFDVANTLPTANRHYLQLRSGIENNGTLTLGNSTNGEVFAEFLNPVETFATAYEVAVSGTGTSTFERIILNKGTGVTEDTLNIVDFSGATIAFNSAGGASDLNNGITSTPHYETNGKPLWLVRGTFKLSSTTANLVINSSAYNTNCTQCQSSPTPTATDLAQTFRIPENTMLWINNGTMRITGNGCYAGVDLIGKLKMSGGNFVIKSTAGVVDNRTNNYIEVKNSEVCQILIEGGTVEVGGQIRRAPTSTVGALRYIQRGGELIVGSLYNIHACRGVMEVMTDGSYFEMRGGKLTVVQPALGGSFTSATTSDPTISDLYLYPSGGECTGGTVQIGSNTAGMQTPASPKNVVELESQIPLWNLEVLGSNSATAKLMVRNLQVNNDLTINSGNTFNANSRSLLIGRHMIDNGTYTGSDTTYFVGFSSATGIQEIKGTSATTFKHLVTNNIFTSASTLGTVYTRKNIGVTNSLSLISGILDDDQKTIDLDGDIYTYATHRSPVVGTGGILFNTNAVQRMFNGAGNLGNVTINKANEHVYMLAPHTINGRLTLSGGLLDIDKYLLTMGEDSEFSGTFSNTRMIRSAGSAFEGGVKKLVKAGAFDFTIPIGTKQAPSDKYTYARFQNTDAASTTGSILVRSVNGAHPATTKKDANTELNHYWKVESDGISPMRIKAYYQYLGSDVRGSENEYVAGRFSANDKGWSRGSNTGLPSAKPGYINGYGTTREIVFDGGSESSNAGSSFVQADYTAGYSEEFFAVDTFRSILANGVWENPVVWDKLTPPTYGAVVIVKSGHTVTMEESGRFAVATIVEAGATLDVSTSRQHYLGTIQGTGTIRLSSGQLPNGIYDEFVASGGGTVEYTGTSAYDLLRVPVYNNLTISNTSKLDLPDADMKLNGTLFISGASCPLGASNTYAKLENRYGRNITIAGNLINNGVLNTGFRGSIITFDGAVDQFINGCSVTNFRNLAINKSNATVVHIENGTQVAEKLMLTQGIFNVYPFKRMTLTDNINDQSLVSDQGSNDSYVQGYLCKVGNKPFIFPTGDTYWARLELTNYLSADANTVFCAEHFVRNHGIDNPRRLVGEHLFATAFAPSTPTSDRMAYRIKSVSTVEYWDIDRDLDAGDNATVRVSMYFENIVRSQLNTFNPLLMVHFGNLGYVATDDAGTAFTSTVFTTAGAKWFEEPNSSFITSLTGAIILSSGQNWQHYSPGAVGSSNTQLPVRLLEFAAKLVKDQIQLDWKTILEENTNYFVVQRSVDGINFSDLVVVNAVGNSARLQNYQAFDRNPLGGISYYRLKIVDFDQETTYSRIVAVSRQASTQNSLIAFPNPSRSGTELYLKIDNFAGQDANLTITDAMGRLITNRTLRVPSGNSIVLVEELSQILPAGIYVVKIIAQEGVFTQKVLIGK